MPELQLDRHEQKILTLALATSNMVTVPEGEWWLLKHLQAALYTTAAAGDRQPTILITDGTDAQWTIVWNTTVAASLIAHLSAAPHLLDRALTLTGWKHATTPQPELLLGPGTILYFEDNAGIAPFGDTVSLALAYDVHVTDFGAREQHVVVRH